MAIREDAGALLAYLYSVYEQGTGADAEKVLANMKAKDPSITGIRVGHALEYLRDLGAVNVTLFFGNIEGLQHFNFNKLTPAGINLIEDKPKFKHTFTVELDLMLAKFGWKAEK